MSTLTLNESDRAEILDLLRLQPRTANDIATALSARLILVIRFLNDLATQGRVVRRRAGTTLLYCAAEGRVRGLR